MIITALVEEKDFLNFKNNNLIRPRSWCANICGPNIKIVDEKEYIETTFKSSDLYVRCSFNVEEEEWHNRDEFKKHISRLEFYR